jgi:AhpD family alkylhydroperoxidase
MPATMEMLKARMNHPVMVLPDAMQAMQALGKVAHKAGVPPETIALVELRASQINGCSFCVDMHSRELKKLGETDDRLFGVAAWRSLSAQSTR